MIGNDYWRGVAAAERPADVREAILTGYRDGKLFAPYVPLLKLPPLDRILDFGCGLGRNFPYLRSVAGQVVGFDLAEMVERCRREIALPSAVDLTSDWQWVRQQRFDCVFACLVLQHIEPDELATYLRDFAAMAPWTYVLSRGRSDFGGGVFASIAAASAFTGYACNVVEHDPAMHGLRRSGTVPSAEMPPADDRHYEMLFASARRD